MLLEDNKKHYLNKLATELIILGNDGILPIFLTINLPYVLKKTEKNRIDFLINSVNSIFINENNLTIYFITCLEENSQENIHLHCLWGIRHIINNKVVEENIKNELAVLSKDVWVNILYTKKQILTKVFYIFKNKTIFETNDRSDFIFYVYIYTNIRYQNELGDFGDLMDMLERNMFT